MENYQASILSECRPERSPRGHRSATKTQTSKNHLQNFTRAYKSWLVPYFKSRIRAREFRPVLSFLFTDLNCNLDCHYCYSRGKKIPGMPMQIAKDAVDWLDIAGCRVLAYMGGEPLVRKQFIIDLTRYAKDKGFFVYLPTNGILMDEAFIDEIGRAGVASVNVAVDAVAGYEGIPKYFNRIKQQFEYLVQQEKKYGYLTFFNINITQKNVEDVRVLTEIAHEYGIGTDYHVNEPPIIKYDNYTHEEDGAWITEKEIQDVDEVLDWIIEKNIQGYAMVNSVEHLRAMKRFIRHEWPPWPCRAGELTMIIRLDGTFAPCMELYGEEEDWGNIYDGPKFDPIALKRRQQDCSPHCMSTCNYQVNHYTQSLLYSFQWVVKHTYANFLGTS
ncbi:radical SAM protein [bacterium]|nr:radical SAM protein [bacterium]